ncbi:MAG TPA: methylenetetrahydrofolate reductase [Povalibacter sp.]|nr:methylenetetrahydrofolate reductase [Povalibacter sp.]
MSRLSEKIRAGKFVVTTELTPPKGIDLADLYAKADSLREVVDGINLTESPRARMTIEPTAVAKLLLDRGLEPIVQFTARDRNRIALQADLLGAAVLGIGNAVFMTGDDPANGDHPDAKPVFDLTTIEMLRMACVLNAGRDLAGNELKGAPELFIGATANPGATDLQREMENTRRKIEAGAQFLQTQALYDVPVLATFVDALRPDVGLLVGIIPLKSAKMAHWLNANVPGIRVPDGLIAELDAVAGDEDAQTRVGIDIAARIIRSVRPYCAGVHLMTLGWERHIPAILRASV